MLAGVPDGVEVGGRTAKSGDHSVVILINHATEPKTVNLPAGMENLLQGGSGSESSVELPKYGVAVFTTRAKL